MQNYRILIHFAPGEQFNISAEREQALRFAVYLKEHNCAVTVQDPDFNDVNLDNVAGEREALLEKLDDLLPNASAAALHAAIHMMETS